MKKKRWMETRGDTWLTSMWVGRKSDEEGYSNKGRGRAAGVGAMV